MIFLDIQIGKKTLVCILNLQDLMRTLIPGVHQEQPLCPVRKGHSGWGQQPKPTHQERMPLRPGSGFQIPTGTTF